MKIMEKARKNREAIIFYLLISPWLIGFIFLVLGPMLMSLTLSFFRWDLLTEPEFIGLANYRRAFFEDELFFIALRVTFIYSIFSVPLGLIFSLIIAMLLHKITFMAKFFRTIYYIPVVVSGVAVMVLWTNIFNPQVGLINQTLARFSIQGPGWIFDPNWALVSLIIMSFWYVGGTIIIWLAGLSGIPVHLYESADLDGASKFQKFFYITVPSLSSTILFNLVMGIIGALQTFNQAYIMTDGGPQNSTLFYNFYLWRTAFNDFQMGYASALAWILFIIILCLTLIVFKSSALWVYYEGERR